MTTYANVQELKLCTVLLMLFRKGKHRLFELFVEVIRSPDNVSKNAISFRFPAEFKDEVRYAIDFVLCSMITIVGYMDN